MSREALSLEISRLVSRVVSGEAVDTAERGAALAAKFPGLGMSGEMIGQAIDRAAGMVGMIRNAPKPPKPSRAPMMAPAAVVRTTDDGPTGKSDVNRAANGHRGKTAATVALPVAAQSIDDELAAAIDAEIGNLVTGHTAAHSGRASAIGSSHAPNLAPRAVTAQRTATPGDPADGSSHSKGPVAAFRRALFGV